MLQPLFAFQICLRLILVSGKTHEFIFSPNDTVYYITQHVYEHWPEGKRVRLMLLISILTELGCLEGVWSMVYDSEQNSHLAIFHHNKHSAIYILYDCFPL